MRSPLRRTALAGAVLLTSSLAAIAPDAGAITWPAPTTLSAPGQHSYSVATAVAPNGTASVGWHRNDGPIGQVQVSTREPGGSWSAAEGLTTLGVNAGSVNFVTTPDSTTFIFYTVAEGPDTFRIWMRSRIPGGSWSAPQAVSAAENSASTPVAAYAPDGTLTAAWLILDGGDFIIKTSTRSAAGTWNTPVALSPTGQDSVDPRIVAGPDSSFTISWRRYDGVVQVTSRPAGGVWAPPTTMPTVSNGFATLAVTAQGTTTLAWSHHEGGSNDSIQASVRPFGGAWGPVQTISETGQYAESPDAAAAPDGSTYVAWVRRVDGVYTRIQVASVSPAGVWSPVATVSDSGGDAANPDIVVGPNGSAVVFWGRTSPDADLIQASQRTASGWSYPEAVSSVAFATGQQAAIGADGTLAVAWHQLDSGFSLAKATAIDDLFAAAPLVPDTSAIKGKKTVKKAKAKYSFTSVPPGATFECRVDKKFKKYAGVSKKKANKQVPWKACTSPYVVKSAKLLNGNHTVFVRAVLAGVPDPTPSKKKIKVVR